MVLARKDIPTSYHLSVVVDDAAELAGPAAVVGNQVGPGRGQGVPGPVAGPL